MRTRRDFVKFAGGIAAGVFGSAAAGDAAAAASNPTLAASEPGLETAAGSNTAQQFALGGNRRISDMRSASVMTNPPAVGPYSAGYVSGGDVAAAEGGDSPIDPVGYGLLTGTGYQGHVVGDGTSDYFSDSGHQHYSQAAGKALGDFIAAEIVSLFGLQLA